MVEGVPISSKGQLELSKVTKKMKCIFRVVEELFRTFQNHISHFLFFHELWTRRRGIYGNTIIIRKGTRLAPVGKCRTHLT